MEFLERPECRELMENFGEELPKDWKEWDSWRNLAWHIYECGVLDCKKAILES